jgi:hypothetical protein
MNDDPLGLENQAMNVYEVTCDNGEVLEIEAWTPTIAQTIAEEEAEMEGRSLSVVSVKFLHPQTTEV